MKSASVTAALDKMALTKSAVSASLMAGLRSARTGGALGAGIGGISGLISPGENESRLKTALRRGLLGAGLGAGANAGGSLGYGVTRPGRKLRRLLQEAGGLAMAPGARDALADNVSRAVRSNPLKTAVLPVAGAAAGGLGGYKGVQSLVNKNKKAPEQEAPKETPVKKASLSKDAAVLREVLSKKAYFGAGLPIGLVHGAFRSKDPGESRLGSIGRGAARGAGSDVGSGVGTILGSILGVMPGIIAKRPGLAVAGGKLGFLGGSALGAHKGYRAGRALTKRPAERDADTKKKKPKAAPKETPVKKASLSEDAAVLRGVLEKQALVGGIGRMLLRGGGHAMQGIGGLMGRAGLEQSGKMVSGAGTKLRRLRALSSLGHTYGAGASEQALDRLTKASPEVLAKLQKLNPQIERAQGIAQLTGLGATGLGAGALLSGGGGGAPAPAQESAGITPEQMMMFQQMLQQGQGQGMNTSASPKNDGIQKAAVARELGRITAGTVLVKQAADRNFKVRTATFTLLAKKAGYRADEINAVVKSAALKKQAWLKKLLPLVGSATGLGALGLGGYHAGKGLGWWGAAEDPTQKKMREFGEMMQKGQQMGLNPDQIKMIAGKDPRFAHMFASPAAGAAGAGAAGGRDPKWDPWTAKLHARAGINPDTEQDTSDALMALSHGAYTRQQRGNALQNIARMNYSYGV